MRILAIETSCDETAIAIAGFFGSRRQPSVRVWSHIVSSQIAVHRKFGGVVPNLARREHEKNLIPILLKALQEAGVKKSKIQNQKLKIQTQNQKIQKIEKILERESELLKQFKKIILSLSVPDIDAIAVTYGPGLAPALWVGVNFAKVLAYVWQKPLIPVNHMEGHLYSAFLQKSRVRNFQFPAIALLVSGGHTELVLMRGHGKYKILGETLDDAAGEAFDKVARLLGLKYPGGPEIAKFAENGDPKKYPFPSPMLYSKDYNFSFSGLKTAVLYCIRDSVPYLVRYSKNVWKWDIAASFQKAVVDVLVKKTIRAAHAYKAKTILVGGGVAANQLLRERLAEAIKKEIPTSNFQFPASSLCGDNALMIATAAYFSGKKKAPNKVGADANVRLSE